MIDDSIACSFFRTAKFIYMYIPGIPNSPYPFSHFPFSVPKTPCMALKPILYSKISYPIPTNKSPSPHPHHHSFSVPPTKHTPHHNSSSSLSYPAAEQAMVYRARTAPSFLFPVVEEEEVYRWRCCRKCMRKVEEDYLLWVFLNGKKWMKLLSRKIREMSFCFCAARRRPFRRSRGVTLLLW